MNVELNGVLKVIFVKEQINDNLTKQEIVVTVDENTQYPQDIVCQFLNQKTELLSGFKMGDRVSAKVDLRGREHNGKYYNQFNGWSIQKK